MPRSGLTAISSDSPDSALVRDAWVRYSPSAQRFAAVLVGPHDANDITITAFLRATQQSGWTKIDRFDTYLIRAVRNEAQNLHRQRKRRWQRDLAAVRPETIDATLPEIDLLRAIAALSLQQRSVVFMAYWEQMTETEIAEALELSRGTVHRNLTRARTTLRKALT